MSIVLHDLALVLGMAAVISVVFRWIRQPPILGYLLAGLAVGPHVPWPVFVDPVRVHALSELGVVLVMFAIGLEFSLRRFGDVLPKAGFVAFVQIGTMLWLGELMGRAFGWTPIESLFLGAALSISSTMIVARSFAELGVTGPMAELVLGILLVQDMAAVLLLAVLTTVAAGGGHAAGGATPAVGPMVAALAALVVGGLLVVPRLIRLVGRIAGPETLLIVGVGLCFMMALAAHAAGFSVALGAFLAGMFVAESGEAPRLTPLVAPLRDLFAAVFFVSIGMLVDPAGIVLAAPMILAVTLLVLVGMSTSITLAAFFSGRPLRVAVRAGLSLAQIGEFSFIMAAVGAAAGVTDGRLTTTIVAVGVLTTFTTPWLIRSSGTLSMLVKQRLSEPLLAFTALYAAWIEPDRDLTADAPAWRRLWWSVRPLLLWAGSLASLVVLAPAGWGSLIPHLAPGTGGPPSLTRGLLAVVLGALAAPLIVGLLRSARTAGVALGALWQPTGRPAGVPATTAQRALGFVLQIIIAAVATGLIIAATRPGLSPAYNLARLLMAVLILSGLLIMAWRGLREHLRQGRLELAGMIRSERGAAVAGFPGAATDPAGAATARIPVGALYANRTIAELDLDGRFGATVTGLIRVGAHIRTPGGDERLVTGDVLVIRGRPTALAAARAEIEADSAPNR